jgi:hypothetical protein
MKTIGISSDQLIKSAMQTVKPASAEAPVTNPLDYFSSVFTYLVKQLIKNNGELQEFSQQMIKNWLVKIEASNET